MLIINFRPRIAGENPEKVSGTAFDVYDIHDLKSHLTDNSNAPHVAEIDTILLGEIADEGLIAEINPATYGLNTPGAYLPFTLEAVQYSGRYLLYQPTHVEIF